MMQSPQLKYHVQTIGIDQPLRNNAIYEHKCLENINNHTNKLVSVSTSNNSKILLRLLWFLLLKKSPMTFLYLPWYQNQSRNHVLENHCVFFTNILDVKKKTANCWVGDAKSKRKAIKYGNTPRGLKQNQKGNSKINEQINKSSYNWIIHNPQVVQSPIVNDFLKLNIDGHTEPQLVPKYLLQVSVR